MGKEATIGLAVILILLITFGVVLVRRLGGSDDPAAAAMEDGDKDSSRARGDPSAGDREAEAPAAVPNRLRVLKPAPSQAPQFSPPAVSQFAVVSDNEAEVRRTDAATTQMASPSIAPIPSAPAWPDPDVLTGGGVRQADASQLRQLRPVSTAIPTGDGRPYDPFRKGAAETQTADVAQVGQTPGRLRSLGPPRQTPRQSGGSNDDYPASHGYTTVGSATRQAPAWRQTVPYTYPAQSQQAQTVAVPQRGSYLGPPYRSPYEGKDFRNVDGEYEVQPNDSYWVISQKLYGSGAYFRALAEHNRDRVPREDRLDVGEVISAPSLLELEKAYPDLCPRPSRRETVRNRASLVSTRSPYVGGRIYVVEEGDTLFDIARYELGKASRWVEILRLNGDLIGDDVDYISPGMQLVLPDEEPSERVTQRPRSVYPP
ncbi:MAG: LysM peptidoglycan-binding domain-containing protein [Planctomycetota bacterium]|jgi:nucleoid-associated protein YgaU